MGVAALAFVLVPPAARADEPNVSADRARAARDAGLVRPLSGLLKMIMQRYDGDVIEANLHEMDGKWIYEFELLPKDGRIFEIYVDAGTGQVISTEGHIQSKR